MTPPTRGTKEPAVATTGGGKIIIIIIILDIIVIIIIILIIFIVNLRPTTYYLLHATDVVDSQLRNTHIWFLNLLLGCFAGIILEEIHVVAVRPLLLPVLQIGPCATALSCTDLSNTAMS